MKFNKLVLVALLSIPGFAFGETIYQLEQDRSGLKKEIEKLSINKKAEWERIRTANAQIEGIEQKKKELKEEQAKLIAAGQTAKVEGLEKDRQGLDHEIEKLDNKKKQAHEQIRTYNAQIEGIKERRRELRHVKVCATSRS